ncbi:MAG: hypothetical protein CMJ25_04455 [Phycisphaerae bacterium]|nr:hypothetical protein [Phycisphaerae bacterium]|tara:strand:+ start:43 stop:705 length:663 start_codon:yes stop_codon:yes gene_type:complete
MKLQITVPESLSEITLEQYQKFDKVNTTDNHNSNFLFHKTVEIFCNIDLKDIAKIRVSTVKDILSNIDGVFAEKPKLKTTFKLDDVEFGFIPDLDDMTLGEFIDLDETITDWKTMHQAMAILYRPVTFKKGDKYLIEEYDGIKNAEAMKRMPLDIAMGAMVFFWKLNNELLEIILNYLEKEMDQNLTTQQKETLEGNGVGISLFMSLVEEMLPNSMLSQP